MVIYEIECGRSWHVCERARYARERQLRAAWHLRARRARGDARPDDDDAPRRGGERPPDDDAHALDALVTVPYELPPLLKTEPTFQLNLGSAGKFERRCGLEAGAGPGVPMPSAESRRRGNLPALFFGRVSA
jgi:hypothetical protein